MRELDAGDPIVLLAPVHVGCYAVFGSDRVGRILDLKGKNVAVAGAPPPSVSALTGELTSNDAPPVTGLTDLRRSPTLPPWLSPRT